MKTTAALLCSFAMAMDAAAFVGESIFPLTPASTSQLYARSERELSRRSFALISGSAVASLVAKPAIADEMESPSVSNSILQSSNLRSLRRAEKQLSKLEFYAVENEYENMKLALRNAPFSEVRKNSFALIKEYAGQPDQQAKLNESYELFISAVEKLDSTASLGLRGRKLDKGALLQSFQATAKALSDWIAVAAEVEQAST